MNRRTFIKTLCIGSSGILFGSRAKKAHAQDINEPEEFAGVLCDTTFCTGCRLCEDACAKANNLPEVDLSDKTVLEKPRQTSPTQYTVVNRYETEQGIFNVKMQCMHCNQASCVSSCLVGSLKKNKTGPVTWRENCMGCRYCMVACPFDSPKFEYNSPTPRIQKCTLCYETRLKEGKAPACVEACSTGALHFGSRREVLDEAYKRIYEDPDYYYHHVYGEHEVGGTGWIYTAAVPFEKIGFRTGLGKTPYTHYTKGFLSNIAVVDLVIPPLLLGMSYIAKSRRDKE